MNLRPYQSESVAMVYAYIRQNPGKNPCLELPTGAGKSVVLAEICRYAMERWPEVRVLMLTHVKELIEQNARKMRELWPGAPLGVYSAGLGKRQLDRAITFAGIQSIHNKAAELGPVNLIIVDEAHLIPTKDAGRYRSFFVDVLKMNPRARIVGLTATPYRLGHGMITEGDGALFDNLIRPPGSTVLELIEAGYLAPLSSKNTGVKLLELVGDVAKRGGDFVESQLAAAVNKSEPNELIAREIIARAEGTYKHWLLFCVSVDHAMEMARILTGLGEPCGVVHGGMSSLDRSDVLSRFRAGEYRAVANVNVLTTGFDFPDIDLLAFIRPTLSATLYCQMSGRGMRLKSHIDHCRVLDFAGLVATHGPITDIAPGGDGKRSTKPGEAPIKPCPECDELVSIAARVCSTCEYKWPEPEKKAEEAPRLHNDDIMDRGEPMLIDSWRWSVHDSHSGKKCIRCDYMTAAGGVVSEYFAIWHEGKPATIAKHKLRTICKSVGRRFDSLGAAELLRALNAAPSPSQVRVKKDGKYDGKYSRVLGHMWMTKDGLRKSA